MNMMNGLYTGGAQKVHTSFNAKMDLAKFGV